MQVLSNLNENMHEYNLEISRYSKCSQLQRYHHTSFFCFLLNLVDLRLVMTEPLTWIQELISASFFWHNGHFFCQCIYDRVLTFIISFFNLFCRCLVNHICSHIWKPCTRQISCNTVAPKFSDWPCHVSTHGRKLMRMYLDLGSFDRPSAALGWL